MRVIIYGSGAMARMVAEYIDEDEEWEVVAKTVDRGCIDHEWQDRWPLIPFDEIEKRCAPRKHYMLVVVGYREMNHLRAERHDQAMQMGYLPCNYVHPSVHMHKSIKIGKGNIILDHTSIHPFTSLGDCNFVSSNVNLGHGNRIRNNCWINAGVSIAGEVDLGNNCFVGQNAFITDNLDIADETFIAAGTRISRATEFGDVYVSPAGEKFPMSSRKFIEWSER